MRSLLRVLGVGVLTLAVSGCWLAPGAGPDRRSFNPFEQTLTVSRVPQLTEAFRVPLTDGAGPPVVFGAALYVRSGLSIKAFRSDTGAPRWSTPVPPDGTLEPSTVGDPFIAGDGKRVFTSVLIGQGGLGGIQLVTLAADTGAPTRQGYEGELQSLRGTTGASVWRTDPAELDATNVGVRDLTGGPVWGGYAIEAKGGVASLGEDLLYLAGGNQVLAYDPATPCPFASDSIAIRICNSEWVRPVGSAVTPVVIGDDSTVYTASAAGLLYALSATTGGTRWQANIGSGVSKAPALANGILYAGSSDGKLSAIAAGGCGFSLCSTLWSTAGGSPITTQPVVAGGVVYVGAADGSIRAYNAAGCGAATCPAIWSAAAGSSVDGGLAVEGGRLYAGTHNALVGYRLPPS